MRILVTWLALTLAMVSVARGQPQPDAERLFADGMRLMSEGSYAAACAAFEQSQRLDVNLSTLMKLATCREKTGQLATAWALFVEAEVLSRDRAAVARYHDAAAQRIAALAPRLSTLTVTVTEPVPDGFALTLDGVALVRSPGNASVPVDGGAHVLAATAPGFRDWSLTVDIAPEGDAQHATVPALEPLTPAAPAPSPSITVPTAALQAAPSPASPRRSVRRTVALGLGAGSVVALGASAVLGWQANTLRDDAAETCTRVRCSMDDSVAATRLHARAQRRALATNISLGVAAASATAAVVLWLTGDDEPRPRRLSIAPQLGNANGLAVAGSF